MSLVQGKKWHTLTTIQHLTTVGCEIYPKPSNTTNITDNKADILVREEDILLRNTKEREELKRLYQFSFLSRLSADAYTATPGPDAIH